MAQETRALAAVVAEDEGGLLERWLQEQRSSGASREDLIRPEELRRQCQAILTLLAEAARSGTDASAEPYRRLRERLGEIARTRAQQGFTSAETARFVFSLKAPLFTRLRERDGDPERLAAEIWTTTAILDDLGLLTTDVHLKAREEVIQRQQQDMLELSTPVVKLWHGILALPLIGTLDSARTQVVMESLLQRVVETECEIAIIDITGVPTVDTLVAQHLLKTVTAARLMGAECIISGIRPQIAQTIVHLGISLEEITTKSSLADAFREALNRLGMRVVRAGA